MRRYIKIVKSDRGVFEPAMREEDVLGQIRQLLEARGARVFRSIERVPKCYRCGQWLGSSEKGLPDIFGWIFRPMETKRIGLGVIFCENTPAVPFFIEVKRPKGGRKRPAQVAFIEKAKADGMLAFFAKSVDEVIEEFKQHGIKLVA